MNTARFIMIGGFLGAGKTTTLAKLAKRYQDQGHRVVIVTNDQATDLVDTNLLRSMGFNVGEVAGSCFCCNFDALTSAVENLAFDQRPDIILAEPVGSCTDLVATVIRPLEQVYEQPLEIAPYGVIIKPGHGKRILAADSRAGFSPQAEYIFRKQIEEADFVVINRIDELSEQQVDELSELVEASFPDRPVIRMSAHSGEGFDSLCEFLERRGEFGKRVMDLDYEIYAQGEADLGWLNAQLRATSEQPFDLDQLLINIMLELREAFSKANAETAHLKTIGMHDGYYAVANLISSFEDAQLSLSSNCETKTADIVINARVAIDPDQLGDLVRQVVADVSAMKKITSTIRTLQSFKPGRPVPTHRIT